MTADNRVGFQVHLSDAATEATTWSIAYIDRVANQLESEIYGITTNEQMRFKKELSVCMIKFEAWWKAIGDQKLRNSIKQCVIHFGYRRKHLVSHISESIWRMGSGNDVPTAIAVRLNIGNVT